MCVSPIPILNPNYGNTSELALKTVDTVSKYISVPCNHCCECLAARQAQLVQRLRLESITSHFFFATLTYRNEMLPYVDTSTGYRIAYADIADVVNMIKRLRKSNAFGRPFRYFAVSERGSERGRPHFHVLFLVEKRKGDTFHICNSLALEYKRIVLKEWRRNIGTSLRPVWSPLCKYAEKFRNGTLFRNYDLHFVDPATTQDGCSNVSFYVSKYLLKPSDKERRLHSALRLNLPPEEYDAVWNLVKSRSFKSLNFGVPTKKQVAIVRDAIEKTQHDPDGFKLTNPINGHPEPISRYFRKFVHADNAINSVAARGGPLAHHDVDTQKQIRNIQHFKKIQTDVERHDFTSFL